MSKPTMRSIMTTTITHSDGDAVTMTSLELLELVNQVRAEFGESKVRHNDFAARCRDELDGEFYETFVIKPEGRGRPSEALRMTADQCKLVAMRESKGVRRRVLARLSELERAVTSHGFTVPQTRAEALRLAADLEEQNAQLLLENQQQALRIESMASIFQAGMTPTQFCKRLNGVNTQQVNGALLAIGWIYDAERDPKRSAKYRVSSKSRDKYLTEGVISIEKEGGNPLVKYTLVLLQKGAARLHELYLQEALPMKADWDGKFTHAKLALGGRQ